jgi:nucleoside 2-deoxyribosyltransferase
VKIVAGTIPAMNSAHTGNSQRGRPKVYLAGPDVFFPDCAEIYGALKAHCLALGMEGLAPTDTELSPAIRSNPGDLAQAIFEGNVALIRQADAVIANLVPFRGQEPDSGTVFEVGFAVALGKPVAGYGVPPGTYAERVARSIACSEDGAGKVREVATGVTVEGLGQPLNLMLSRSIRLVHTAQEALDALARELLSP